MNNKILKNKLKNKLNKSNAMEKKITKETIKHAIKVIKLYVEQNPRRYEEDTIIHERDCEGGLAHGECYCTRHRKTRLNYELDNIIE